ncbi:MAG: type II toxin-antitoxin system prevent-host-death family antitoxin [Nitrospirae bacterium]|nr:type II toxin-antitoxin system prevent-host-death family antitoxin [Nitrospirota bacterium]MBF0542509.1 type II toxin-antitoxin system prevent-host-death family antitoxin [Nitrospirota bacterium]
MKVASTEIKNRLAKYLDASFTEPVTIERSGREVAVLVSAKEFKRLKEIEMKYKDELIINGDEDRIKTLRGLMNESHITDKDIEDIKEIWK